MIKQLLDDLDEPLTTLTSQKNITKTHTAMGPPKRPPNLSRPARGGARRPLEAAPPTRPFLMPPGRRPPWGTRSTGPPDPRYSRPSDTSQDSTGVTRGHEVDRGPPVHASGEV